MAESKMVAVKLYKLIKKKGVFVEKDKKAVSEKVSILSRDYVKHYNSVFKIRGLIYQESKVDTKAYYSTTQGKIPSYVLLELQKSYL